MDERIKLWYPEGYKVKSKGTTEPWPGAFMLLKILCKYTTFKNNNFIKILFTYYKNYFKKKEKKSKKKNYF